MTSKRASDALRPIRITPNYTSAPAGSALIECGDTRVLCTASVDTKVPSFRMDRGGWLTAEYSMLPGSSPVRVRRPGSKPSGRSTEIQRLIGRSLRAAFDLDALGSHTVWIDCDVIQADGGTRTASITGGYVAARLAIDRLVAAGSVPRTVLADPIAAVSVGVVGGKPYLDLDYDLDHRADVDMNVVMTGKGAFIEVQGTAENSAFSRRELDVLLDLAQSGIDQLFEHQRVAIAEGLA